MVKKNALFSAVALIALWLVWVIAYYIVRNDYVLPSFWETLRETGRLLGEASFWRAFGNTFLRTLWAFLVSLALGVGLAIPAHLVGGAVVDDARRRARHRLRARSLSRGICRCARRA